MGQRRAQIADGSFWHHRGSQITLAIRRYRPPASARVMINGDGILLDGPPHRWPASRRFPTLFPETDCGDRGALAVNSVKLIEIYRAGVEVGQRR